MDIAVAFVDFHHIVSMLLLVFYSSLSNPKLYVPLRPAEVVIVRVTYGLPVFVGCLF